MDKEISVIRKERLVFCRAKAEEKYGRDLIQLAKQAGGREEIGYILNMIV